MPYLTQHELDELDKLIAADGVWTPLPGPQRMAYDSEADIVGYGGAAGGGKTDLICGLILTKHIRSIVYRREGVQLNGITQRLEEIVGSTDGYSTQRNSWRLPGGRLAEFGGVKDPGDHKKYQGRPHDLKAFDEVTEMRESQARFLMGWLRSNDKKVRQKILMAFNPPTDSDGEWVIEFFGAWLDQDHPHPAKPGELRWYTTIEGKDVECPGPDAVEVDGEIVEPLSRTFIPARVEDNPYYMETGYKRILQGLPEPLRSQMLKGDFKAGKLEDPWQVIPASWVEMAQARWTKEGKQGPMDQMGVDVARGGADSTVIEPRYGKWFDEPKKYPGSDTPSGPITASLVITELRDQAVINVDVIGWGSSAYDHLKLNGLDVYPVNNAEGTGELDKTGCLRFANVRARDWWRMREALDPQYGDDLALPPGREVKADLCAPRWKMRATGIQLESKEELKVRLGRSPDVGDAIVMANRRTPKRISNQITADRAHQMYEQYARPIQQ